jgi:hypothetical protein
LQVYVHALPLHPPVATFSVPHVAPHAPQFDVVLVCVSHPLVFGAVVLQSA